MKEPMTQTQRRGRPAIFAAMAVIPGLLLSSCTTTEPDRFDMADTNDDKAVSLDEFDRFMLESIFAEADADGDKKVTFEEWKAANPDAEKSKFSAPDTNKDGVVTPQEAKDHFDRQGTMKDLFNKIDTNGDGLVTRDEVAAYKEKLEAQSGTKLQKLSRSLNDK